jgi:hypothetical protein
MNEKLQVVQNRAPKATGFQPESQIVAGCPQPSLRATDGARQVYDLPQAIVAVSVYDRRPRGQRPD